MRDSSLFFAVLAGISLGSYAIFQKLGSTNISPPLGSMVISCVAFSINLVVLLGMRARSMPIAFSGKGLGLLILVGVSAAGVDLFGLLAYSRGLRISSSLIITGTQATVVLVIGFLALREPFSWTKLGALSLIVVGVVILQRFAV